MLHHHEAWDGGGYPDGLKGEECPRLARIVAVADSIDAMSSDRPYRKGMPDEKLDKILRDGAGRQWDAKVVDAVFQVRDELRKIGHSERESLSSGSRKLGADGRDPAASATNGVELRLRVLLPSRAPCRYSEFAWHDRNRTAKTCCATRPRSSNGLSWRRPMPAATNTS